MAIGLQKSTQHVAVHLDVVNNEHRAGLDSGILHCHKCFLVTLMRLNERRFTLKSEIRSTKFETNCGQINQNPSNSKTRNPNQGCLEHCICFSHLDLFRISIFGFSTTFYSLFRRIAPKMLVNSVASRTRSSRCFLTVESSPASINRNQ
jgi:hypothetical protein